MKTAIWESSPGALVALLNAARSGGTIRKAHLYTFALRGGGSIAITDADLDIYVPTLGVERWSSTGVRVDVDSSRATAHWKRGLDVDEWLVVVAPRVVDSVTGETFPDKIGTVPWTEAVRQGALDGADVLVDRAYFTEWPQPWTSPVTPTGVLRMFAGRVAEVDVGDIMVPITLRDYRQILQAQQSPVTVFQAGCRHTLFDAGCQLIAASFAVSGTAIGGSSRGTLKATAAPPGGSSGTFALGRVVMTSGLNSGFSRGVRDWSTGSFSLLKPLPFDIVAGDTFTAYPGCDKSQAACALFSNILNFGGQSYIPATETAI